MIMMKSIMIVVLVVSPYYKREQFPILEFTQLNDQYMFPEICFLTSFTLQQQQHQQQSLCNEQTLWHQSHSCRLDFIASYLLFSLNIDINFCTHTLV